jgi:hypothetical protein
MDKGTRDEKRFVKISAECRLAPYQMGVVQDIEIISFEETPIRWAFIVLIKRIAGSIKEWERLNRDFINAIREQFLLWRTLPDRSKYL